jgi:hypothetical protein
VPEVTIAQGAPAVSSAVSRERAPGTSEASSPWTSGMRPSAAQTSGMGIRWVGESEGGMRWGGLVELTFPIRALGA